MNLKTAMKQLEAAGSEQTRKTYARHGADPNMFGVSWATLRPMAKQIGPDQALAEELWQTGNHDARTLATLIVEPEKVTARLLERWRKDLTNYGLTDLLSGLAAGAGLDRSTVDAWCDSKEEWTSSMGWGVVGRRAAEHAAEGAEGLEYLRDKIATIEREVHSRPNRTRHMMHMALIGIAASSPKLKTTVLAAAKRIGPIQVDHGDTGCVTPAIAPYLAKMEAHASRVKPRAAARKPGVAPKTKARAVRSAR